MMYHGGSQPKPQRKHVGYYDTEQEAAVGHDRTAVELLENDVLYFLVYVVHMLRSQSTGFTTSNQLVSQCNAKSSCL
jgi:hypothetical protein